MKTQYLERKVDNPFMFLGVSFPNAILALQDVREFAGHGSGNRDVTVIITAHVFASKDDMDARPEDYLRKFQFTFTRTNFEAKEFSTNGTLHKSFSNDQVNAEALNIVVNDTELAMFKYDVGYKGGKIFTEAGLQALLQMPSINEDKVLGDEWSILNQ